jgi:predicted TIM-barrel fold metal-dependent hydrolase
MALAGCAAPAPSGPRTPIVDTHLHCFAGKDDARFPYHERAPYAPDAPATPEHLLRCMDGAGVDYAVVVHPEPYQDDHRYLEHCLAVGKGRLKGTCLFFADRPGSVAQMAPLVKRLPIVTARIHAYVSERLPPFAKPELKAYWKEAIDLGLAIQLHFEPRWAAHFEPYLQEFSSAPVVIDHLGRPFQGTGEEHARVVEWGAKFRNTVIKISAIPPPTQYPHRDIAPVIRRLADAFGPDRMIWGGSFGADSTPESYRADRERARSFIAHLSPADQAKVLGGTAARLYRFG